MALRPSTFVQETPRMTRKSIFTLCFALSIALHAVSQSIETRQRILDASIAYAKWQGSLSGAYVHNWLLGNNNKVVVGAGVRFTGYLGRNQNYVTAPAKLTSGRTGPGVIFIENITANMDTFLIDKPLVFATNIFVNLGWRFNEKLSAGFDIDVIGFSFGPPRKGNYINGSVGGISDASITPFNILLVSDNDIGTLNSELYARYMVNDRLGLRTGLQFLFTEYTTDMPVQQFPEPNDRFRRKSLMFMMGVSLNLDK